jgi:hypothetical protein
MNERKCGSCRVCCSVMEITALEKPQFTPCVNLVKRQTTKSCSVYNERPAECRSFRCAWLSGFGTNAQRPDRCGVMLTGTSDQNKDAPVMVMQGFRFRDHITSQGTALWERATDLGVILEIKRDGENTIHGDPSKVSKFVEYVRAKMAEDES